MRRTLRSRQMTAMVGRGAVSGRVCCEVSRAEPAKGKLISKGCCFLAGCFTSSIVNAEENPIMRAAPVCDGLRPGKFVTDRAER